MRGNKNYGPIILKLINSIKNNSKKLKTIKSSRWDKLFKYGSDLATIGLFLLAFFGYFYTVRPFYQNQLLAEDISKKELELRKIENELILQRKALMLYKVKNDSLEVNYFRKSKELNSVISSLSLSLLDKESAVKNAEKTLFNLHLMNYIKKIEIVALNYSTNMDNVKIWVDDYQNELYNVIYNSIKKVSKFRVNDSLTNIPNSLQAIFESKSIQILERNKNNLFGNFETSRLKKNIEYQKLTRTICDTASIQKKIDDLRPIVYSETDPSKQVELLKIHMANFSELLKCLSVYHSNFLSIQDEIRKIIKEGFDQFSALLLKNIKYTE
jgi:hypothetical protein